MGRNTLKNKKGFTMVETVITVAVSIILLSAAAFSLFAYTSYATFKRENEYAQSLFVAAQNALTHFSENGELVSIESNVTRYSLLLSQDSLDGEAKTAFLNSSSDLKGRIYSITVNRDGLINGKRETDNSYKYLKETFSKIFGDYVYDKSILSDASITIEFDPLGGVVYSVLYSDRHDGFFYGESTNESYISISNRDYDVRKNLKLGYYGIEDLSGITSRTKEKPVIETVKLVNDTSLQLQFRLSNKYAPVATGVLDYTLDFYNAESRQRLMSVTLDDLRALYTISGEADTAENLQLKDLPVTVYNSDGTVNASYSGNYSFICYVDNEYMAHLYLDCVDTYTSDSLAPLSESYSLHRFHLEDVMTQDDSKNIYVNVCGEGGKYKTTAWKRSNSENMFFASESQSKSELTITENYVISNARHLYNVRFEEDKDYENKYSKVNEVNYTVNSSFSWTGSNGMYNSDDFLGSAVFNNMIQIPESENIQSIAFPCIEKLLDEHSFTASSSRYVISGIVLYSNEEDSPLGLFANNYGTIERVALSETQVYGKNSVGSFCGINYGKICDLSSLNGSVEGQEDVGGIFGKDGTGSTGSIEYKKLTNGNSVKGVVYVGGIVGRLVGNAGKIITLSDSSNTGLISAASNADIGSIDENTGTYENEACYIGGIVGYACGVEGENANLNITKCVSSPSLGQENLRKILVEDKNNISPVYGVYVGGIVGYSKNATITTSYTKGGCVIGSHYVGGIIGYNDKGTVIEGYSNKATVVSKYYAGGITGANVSYSAEDSNGFIVPLNRYDGNDTSVIDEWINKGIVIATEKYAGGITGYNTGELTNCGSDIEVSESLRELMSQYGGDCIGGIAGYNNGIIDASGSRQDITSYVAGRNYIGGVVGYNDNYGATNNGYINGYGYSGGYIIGNNCVGGFVGLNLSKNIFNGQKIDSNPNSVEGNYFVGGVIGINLVKTENDIEIDLNTNNFLGVINAESAYAGGYIGLNALCSAYAAEEAETLSLLSGTDIESISENAEVVDEVCSTLTSQNSISITGNSRESFFSGNRFSHISSKIYVGGFMGYNAENTIVDISNVINRSPVIATASIVNDELSGDQNTNPYTNTPKDYSYAGSIIGKCTKRMTISNCHTDDTGTVSGVGTYTGGLIEVNEGTLIDCMSGNLGNSSMNYVGGMVGLNKGLIRNPSMDGKTITGNNAVGGIASENYGTIVGDSTQIKGTVIGYGTNIGGIAGYSGGDSSSLSGFELKVSINRHVASGINVGGAVGYCESAFSNISSRFSITSHYVEGNTNVGGIIGVYNHTSTIDTLENNADILAQYGCAGGVVGKTENSTVIKDCENHGSVQVVSSKESVTSYAGGITSNIFGEGKAENCVNYASVEANHGYAGGICAINSGEIESCSTEKPILFSLTLTSRFGSGGIAVINTGIISNSSIDGVTLTNYAKTTARYMGGIVGTNGTSDSSNASLINCSVSDVDIISKANDADIGGIAGRNYSGCSITNVENTGPNVIDTSLKFEDYSMSYYGNIGGVAGVNRGSISGYIVESLTLYGAANNPSKVPAFDPNYDFEKDGAKVYGYGGIAGINGSSENETVNGTITHCTVGSSDIFAIGDSNNVANLGGIAGVNGLGATISNVNFDSDKTRIIAKTNVDQNAYSGFAHIGGIAGYNYGTITTVMCNSDNNTNSAEVDICTGYGHIGGVTGFNRASGNINNVTTGVNWYVYSRTMATDNGLGGIIGYNASVHVLENCNSYAELFKADGYGIGGMIGRNEVTDGTWYIKNSNNYGKVRGCRSGGMIGILKYNGGTIENCNNYGNLLSTASYEAVGGMIGDLYNITRDNFVYVTSCENHGLISGTASEAGGIIGKIRGDSNKNINISVIITDCVNTGRLTVSAGDKGGIMGSCDSGKMSLLSFQNCRNYYLTNNMSGIVRSAVSPFKTYISNCFGVAGGNLRTAMSNAYPIISGSSNANINNSYFFSDYEPSSFGETKLIKSHVALAKNATDVSKGQYMLTYDEIEGCVKDSNGNLFDDSQNENVIGQALDSAIDGNVSTGLRIKSYGVKYPASYVRLELDSAINLKKVNFYANGVNENSSSCPLATTVRVYKSGQTDTGSPGGVSTGSNINQLGATSSQGSYSVSHASGINNVQIIYIVFNTSSKTSYTLLKEISIETKEGVIYSGDDLKAILTEKTIQKEVSGGDSSTLDYLGKGEPVYLKYENGGYKGYLKDNYTKPVIFKGTSTSSEPIYFGTGRYDDFIVDSSDSLTELNEASSNQRKLSFDDFDQYLRIASKFELGKPTDVSISNVSGAIRLSWNCNNAYSYKVELTVLKNGESTTLEYKSYLNTMDISLESLGDYLGGTITDIKVTSYTIFETDDDCKSLSVETSYIIPTEAMISPKIKLLLKNADNGEYDIIVENAMDYARYGYARVTVEKDGLLITNIEIINGVQDTKTTRTSTDTNSFITAYASPAAGTEYGISSKAIRETMIPSSSTLKSTDGLVSLSEYEGTYYFSGTTPDTLTYNLTLNYNLITAFNRVEFIATDNSNTGLGVPVVYSYNTSKTSAQGQTSTKVLINNLPTDLNDDIVKNGAATKKYSDIDVRIYSYVITNEIVYLAEDNVQTYTISELQTLKEEGSFPFESDGTLQSGNVLYFNSDGTYSLTISPLVKAYNDNNNKSVSGNISKGDNVIVINGITGGIETREPVNITAKYNDATGAYLAYWDCNHTEGSDRYTSIYDGTYAYTLTATTNNGAEITIDSGTVNASANRNYLSYPSTDSWNYREVSLTVSHLGTEMGGKTTLFGSSATATTKTRIKLSRQTSPTLSLVSKDNLIYTVRWGGISSSNAEEYAALDSYNYVVTATIIAADGNEHDITATYNTGAGTKDVLESEINFEALTGIDENGITYSGRAVSGSSVKVSITAVASLEQTLYANSQTGVEYVFTLPVRLVTPTLPNISVNQVNGHDTECGVNEFNYSGFNLSYDGTHSEDTLVYGKYEAQVFVADSHGDELVRLNSGESILLSGTRIDSLASYILSSEDLLNADYSNMYLKIKLRAISDSRISSEWSETYTYHLPKVVVDSVEMSNAISVEQMPCFVYTGTGTESTDTLNVPQDVFLWQQSDYINGYEISLKHSDSSDSDDIFVTFNSGNPVVRYMDTPVEVTYLSEDEDEKIWTYNIYGRRVDIVDSDGNAINDLNLELFESVIIKAAYNEGNLESVDYELVVPDAEIPEYTEVPGSVSRKDISISIVTIVSKASNDNYIDSVVSSATRQANDKFSETTATPDSGITSHETSTEINFMNLSANKISNKIHKLVKKQ